MHLLVFEEMTYELRVTNRRLQETQTELHELAITDTLTGCHNRRFFHEVIGRELQRHRRYDIPLALLFVDIDKFKMVNDTLGHDAGDRLLEYVAMFLKRHVREADYLFRWGGDEFLVLLSWRGRGGTRKGRRALPSLPGGPAGVRAADRGRVERGVLRSGRSHRRHHDQDPRSGRGDVSQQAGDEERNRGLTLFTQETGGRRRETGETGGLKSPNPQNRGVNRKAGKGRPTGATPLLPPPTRRRSPRADRRRESGRACLVTRAAVPRRPDRTGRHTGDAVRRPPRGRDAPVGTHRDR